MAAATDIDVLVIGAGIVGSWVARAALDRRLSVAICDRSHRPGDGISARNSGVLHAGIYYRPGSLKARHCVRGKELAESFLAKHSAPVLRCGKLIVAGADEHDRVTALMQNAATNGARVEFIDHPGDRFPGVRGDLALYSPDTCVTDTAFYLSRLHQSIETDGGVLLRGQCFTRIEEHGDTVKAVIEDAVRPDVREIVRARFIVNCAGLHADEVAANVGLAEYEIRPVRGEYHRLRRPHRAGLLVYPLPHQAGDTALGVHYTPHPSGEAYAGPNAIPAASKSDYRITASAAEFVESLSRIVDGYDESDLSPGYAGLRPRLFRNGLPVHDFVTEEYPRNVFHFLGIESPGLTAAPSLPSELPFLKDGPNAPQ